MDLVTFIIPFFVLLFILKEYKQQTNKFSLFFKKFIKNYGIYLFIIIVLYIGYLVKKYSSYQFNEGFCNDNDPSNEYFIMRYDTSGQQTSDKFTYSFDDFESLLTRMEEFYSEIYNYNNKIQLTINNLGSNSILKWYKQNEIINNKPIYYLYENNNLNGIITHKLYYDEISWKIDIYDIENKIPTTDLWERFERAGTLNTEYLLENKNNRYINHTILQIRDSSNSEIPTTNGSWIIKDFDRGSRISFDIIIDDKCDNYCIQQGIGTAAFNIYNNIGTRKLYDEVMENCGGNIVSRRVNLPNNCSQECSNIFIPWFEGCDENKEFLNNSGRFSELQEFYNLCNN